MGRICKKYPSFDSQQTTLKKVLTTKKKGTQNTITKLKQYTTRFI